MAYGTAVKIETITVAAGGTSSIIFNNIPQTYDDLKIVASARGTRSFFVDDLVIRFNGSTTNYSGKRLLGAGGPPGSSPSADSLSDIRGAIPGSTTTADIFGNNEFYIKNYTSSNNKSVSIDAVGENNTVDSYNWFFAGLWSDSSAITSITMFANNGNLTEFSTFTLYGISRVTQGAKAFGGMTTEDNSYWYHTFTSSGVFTPNQNIANVDFLVVAGGGGGGANLYGGGTRWGGGGGAGGYRTSVGTSGRNSSAENTISVTSGTNYTITVGAGGAGGSSGNEAGGNGSNSVFSTITSTGGGGGGGSNSVGAGILSTTNGNGGSGGGDVGGNMSPGTGTTGQGFDGGLSWHSGGTYGGGGGGGAGAAGGNAPSGSGGTGGNGLASSITGTSVIRAGGGAGSGSSSNGSTGGTGGGGASGGAGTSNTGGGGASARATTAGQGGSGIVIVRYAK